MFQFKSYAYLKPRIRSRARIWAGKRYYTLRRYFSDIFSNNRFAKKNNTDINLPITIFEHKTPLNRNLPGVDQYLTKNKFVNLSLAINQINGVIINPGEYFSYWKSIGPPSFIRGYKKGLVLNYGHLTEGYGGGLCQLSNLLFWVILHSPLIVTERHRHSYDVFPDYNRTQPFGSGATCVYNYRDLRFKNITENKFQLVFEIKDGFLCAKLLSNTESNYKYKIIEKNHSITHEHWGKYIRHNQIFRKVFNSQNEFLKDELICENHALMMYEPFIEDIKTKI